MFVIKRTLFISPETLFLMSLFLDVYLLLVLILLLLFLFLLLLLPLSFLLRAYVFALRQAKFLQKLLLLEIVLLHFVASIHHQMKVLIHRSLFQ